MKGNPDNPQRWFVAGNPYTTMPGKNKVGWCSRDQVRFDTAFNVPGEPIVCTPEGGDWSFMRTKMGIVMVLEKSVLYKTDQKPLTEDSDWKKEFELD